MYYQSSHFSTLWGRMASMAVDVRRLVGANVRRARMAAGITQAALAERLGVDRAYVSGVEMGKRNPTIVTMHRFAEALGVKLGRFFDQRGSRAR